MSAGDFSASLMLAGMDYIAPSETCTLPTRLQNTNTVDAGVQRHKLDNSSSSSNNYSSSPYSVKQAVKITLQDCLACSGCVTTAEAILVSSQSRQEVLKARTADMERPFLITVSDQSAASIAVYLKISTIKAFHIISGFFRHILHAKYVADLRWAQSISIEKTAQEYCHRLQNAKEKLPMIVSACPGWVCYCEKQGSAVLPLLCPVMSAQGIAGSYAKINEPQLCHVSVQPCFDRKLEAARDASPSSGERYTDFVLSTQELLEWMMETDSSFPWNAALDSNFESLPISPLEKSNKDFAIGMEGSGGYHRFAMQYAAKELHQNILSPDDIKYDMKRNNNHHLATSLKNPGEVYCIAYGFQNIQNTVRGIKRKLASVEPYTFIELMACPEGCLNGGGQIRKSNVEGVTETITEIKENFGNYIFPQIKEEEGKKIGSSEMTQFNYLNEEQCKSSYFSVSAFNNLEKSVGASLWSCVFHDRQKEFEATLNNGGVQSLKW